MRTTEEQLSFVISRSNEPSVSEGEKKYLKKEKKKLEKRLEYKKLGRIEVSSCEDLQKVITKYRKEPSYRDFCKFLIPTPNKMGEPIYGWIERSDFGASIRLRLKGKEWIDPKTNKTMSLGFWCSLRVLNKDGDLQERDKTIFRQFNSEIFGDFVGNKKIKVKSNLSQMIAQLEYELVVPFDKQMTDEEQQEYIDRYLERPEIEEQIYRKDNFTEFSWDREDMDWEVA